MGASNCFLPHAPSNLVSSLHNAHHDCPSSQNGEICLQKYLPIGGKLSLTKFVKQNVVDCWSRLTIEITFEGRRKDISKTSTTFPPPKKCLGQATRRDKHTKKLESNNYAGILPWKVFTASQGYWKWSDNICPCHSGKREVCSESMTKFSSIQFFVRNATISR